MAKKHLRRAFDDLSSAADTLQGKKKGRKGRKLLLLACVVAGALYNPWTGAQTRGRLMNLIAGDDDLQPLDTFDRDDAMAPPASETTAEGTSKTAADMDDVMTPPASGTTATETSKKAADKHE